MQVLGGRDLQLREQRVGAGIRTGHCGTDPAQCGRQNSVYGTESCQEGTHGNGLTREVHDVCQCQHRRNGQNRPTHTVDDRTEFGEQCGELEPVATLLVEEEVDNTHDQTRNNQQGTGVREPGEGVNSIFNFCAVFGDQAGAKRGNIDFDSHGFQPCLQLCTEVHETEDNNHDQVG